jgi:hypothetical protein
MPRPSKCPRCGSRLISVRTFRDDGASGPASYLLECAGDCPTMALEDEGGPLVSWRREVI